MDMRRLTPDVTVSPQIELSDLQDLAQAGVRTIIDNRPDAEVGHDLSSDAMAAAAKEAGLAFHYLPVTPGQLDEDQIAEFGRLVDASEGPVHAYCRSGTRSASMWALSQSGRRPASEILGAAAEAGYDLSGLAGHLE